MIMTINTTAGKTYAVTPATDCTVTTPAGTLIATCPAGEQTLFVAPATEIEVSDDTALVTESFKGASAGSAAGGGVRTLYEHVTQTPAEGNLSNVNTYGFAIVTTQSGRLDSIALAPRTSGGVADHWPMYLKIWVADGDRWNVLGTSLNAVAQTAETPSVWRFAGINLEAGRKIQIEARKNPESTIHDSRLSVSVVANTLADTGCIDAQGRLSMTDWVPQYTLSLSRETGIGYRGIQLAEQAALDAHTHDAVRHITADERTTWNNKADASALSGKVNTATFNAHKSDAVAHVSAEDRQRWDTAGGMYYADMEITADNSINGLLIPPDAPSGWYEVRVALNFTSADGRPVSVYTYSGTSDPVYDWDGYMTARYAPWYKATPIPQHATREPSGLELRYDWWDASASLSDMGCILYIWHTRGVASPICGVSGAPDGITNLGHIVIRQLTNQ